MNPAFETMPDGREICLDTPAGKKEYRCRTLECRRRQGELCRWCGFWMAEEQTTLDHDNRRGGGRRDDRIVIIVLGKRVRHNAAVHMLCNGERGSQKRLTRLEVIPDR